MLCDGGAVRERPLRGVLLPQGSSRQRPGNDAVLEERDITHPGGSP